MERNFNVAVPLETHFIPYFKKFSFLWGDLSKSKNRRQLLRAIYVFIDIWTLVMMRELRSEKVLSYSLSSTKKYESKIINNSFSFSSLVNEIFNCFAYDNNREYWVEKSAFYEHIDLSIIKQVFPNCKIIHIIREPTSVVNSWMRIDYMKPSTDYEAYKSWNTHVLQKKIWGEMNTDNYKEIFYEDLLTNKKRILNQISNFIGISFSQSNNNKFTSLLEKIEGHQNLSKILRNRSVFTENHIYRFLANNAIKRINKYKVSKTHKIGIQKITYNFLKRFFTAIYYLRLIKRNLPFFIKIIQFFKLEKFIYSLLLFLLKYKKN